MFGSMLIDVAAATLLKAINSRDKRKVRNVCLKLYNAIKAAFADDPAFQ